MRTALESNIRDRGGRVKDIGSHDGGGSWTFLLFAVVLAPVLALLLVEERVVAFVVVETLREGLGGTSLPLVDVGFGMAWLGMSSWPQALSSLSSFMRVPFSSPSLSIPASLSPLSLLSGLGTPVELHSPSPIGSEPQPVKPLSVLDM